MLHSVLRGDPLGMVNYEHFRYQVQGFGSAQMLVLVGNEFWPLFFRISRFKNIFYQPIKVTISGSSFNLYFIKYRIIFLNFSLYFCIYLNHPCLVLWRPSQAGPNYPRREKTVLFEKSWPRASPRCPRCPTSNHKACCLPVTRGLCNIVSSIYFFI